MLAREPMPPKDSRLQLRQARLEDLADLQQLCIESIRQNCQHDYSPAQISVWVETVKQKERWLAALDQQYFLMAEKDDRLVGFGSLAHTDYLDFLYVHPGYLRQGIADRLYQALEKKAQQLGSTHLYAEVSKTAQPFFEKQGFRIVRENRKILQGVEITNFRMSKAF